MDQSPASDLSVALIGFNGEADTYCEGISDSLAHAYAMEYARMLGNRAKGLETDSPKPPYGLFEPNRKLIRSTLEPIGKRHFLKR